MPVATKKAVRFKIANTEIEIGDIVEVVPKKDFDAPSGFQEWGTTKLLSKGVREVRGVPFNETLKMYDTGFELNDTINRRIPPSEKEPLVNLYRKHIKEPYEDLYKVEIENTSDDFWQGYTYEIKTGKRFDTSKAKDLFDLYNALRQGRICEEGEKDPILQRSANYCIKNIKKVQSLKEQKSETKFEAAAVANTLINAFDPEKDDSLYSILEWNNLTNIRGADTKTLKRSVIKLFDNEKYGYENAKRFLEAYEMTQNPARKEVMDLFTMLNKLYHKKKIEYKHRQYFLEGNLLGNHLKEAAEKASLNPELKDTIAEAYSEIVG